MSTNNGTIISQGSFGTSGFSLSNQLVSNSEITSITGGLGGNLTIRDDIGQIGLVYYTDYSSSGVNNPYWVPNYGTIQNNFVSSASNGLSNLLGNVVIGGTLSQPTTVNLLNYSLSLLGTSGSSQVLFNITNTSSPSSKWSNTNGTLTNTVSLVPQNFSLSTGTGASGYNFISDSATGIVILGTGLTSQQNNLSGASQSTHKVQMHGGGYIDSDFTIGVSGNGIILMDTGDGSMRRITVHNGVLVVSLPLSLTIPVII